MRNSLEVTARELKDIQHALFYAEYLHHGTTGHNLLMLVAKLSDHIGFRLINHGHGVRFPTSIETLEEEEKHESS